MEEPTPNGVEPVVEEVDEGDGQKVFVGFHQLGGVRLIAEDIRLSPDEAFILAGQLQAHATIQIHTNYMQQQMEQQQAQELLQRSKIIRT